ncbi:MAG: two-component system, cell cycle response regulator, partial [Solirubrobacteraceae bacterium]|nr:two-component system, cell cycle response regulator [Solirubrobacteraceae bacterium]
MTPVPTPPIRVLLVADRGAAAGATRGMAETPTADAPTRVGRLDEAVALLAAERFDAVLVDLGRPDDVGLHRVRAVREADPSAAVIALDGTFREAIGLQALGAGAQDYLVEGRYDADGLRRSIRFAVARQRAGSRGIGGRGGPDEAGPPAGPAVDATAGREAERLRRDVARSADERDRLLRSVIANSMTLIYVKDLDGRYMLYNPRFGQATGLVARAAAEGVSVEEVLIGRDDFWLHPE